MSFRAWPFLVFFLFVFLTANAQSHSRSDSTLPREKDLKEIFRSKKHKADTAADGLRSKNYYLTVLPAVGYTLQTGFAGILSANVGFYSDRGPDAKLSLLSTSVTYSQYSQIILPVYADIWSKNGNYNFVSDNRYISYPSDIFGLGGKTDPNQEHTIDFKEIKLHQSVLRRVWKDLYAGVGFYYDRYYDITAITPQTRQTNVFLTKELGTSETAAGPTIRALYDSRTNQINPQSGIYVNTVLRQNFTQLGSDKEWASLLIDARAYLNFPKGSKNTLAFWSYNWLTPAGNPAYLLLPSTGWDDQYNTGRGYIQSRFRGKQMLYLETEYRYRITRNGLIGGVVFFNTERFYGNVKPYDNFLPGYGAGLRVKLNKKSGANLCLDYGFGSGGSHGVYVNLGEVF